MNIVIEISEDLYKEIKKSVKLDLDVSNYCKNSILKSVTNGIIIDKEEL